MVQLYFGCTNLNQMDMKILDDIAIEKIIQIVESRTDLTPAEYDEAKKIWLSKILNDKELLRELFNLYSKRLQAEAEMMKFIISVIEKS